MTFRTVTRCLIPGCQKLIRSHHMMCFKHRAEQEARAKRCACSNVIKKTGESQCHICRKVRPVTPESTAPRHIPSSVYVQHDAIAKRYEWARAVCR